MRHRKTACFGALVLEPHFAQSCGRFLLLTWRKVLAAAGSESFMVEKSIAGSGARAEPLQAAAQSIATASQLFPSNAFMASARSFNTFNCMFQIGCKS